jgi:hypothetical protein
MKGVEDEEDYADETAVMYDFHGIPVIELEDEVIFKNETHRTIYNQTHSKEHRAINLEVRHHQKKMGRMTPKHTRNQRAQFIRLK